MEKMTTNPQVRMRKLAVTLALLCGAYAHLPAQAQNGVYLCTNASGARELTDSYRAGCKTLNLPGSIPAPQQSSPRRAAPPRAPVSTPADFPKVDNAQQKARDNVRREILNEELRMEEKKLADARKEFNGGEPERQKACSKRSHENQAFRPYRHLRLRTLLRHHVIRRRCR